MTYFLAQWLLKRLFLSQWLLRWPTFNLEWHLRKPTFCSSMAAIWPNFSLKVVTKTNNDLHLGLHWQLGNLYLAVQWFDGVSWGILDLLWFIWINFSECLEIIEHKQQQLSWRTFAWFGFTVAQWQPSQHTFSWMVDTS